MVFLVRDGGAENSEKRRKPTEEKHWKIKRKKNEEYREIQITTIHVICFTFCIYIYIYIQNILLEHTVWKE